MEFLKQHKTIIISMSILLFCFISIYSICFGMEEIESLDFTVGQVTAERLNVRRGPGITYENVGILSNGAYIRVFAKIGNWYVVQTENDIIGAVCADYIEPCYDVDYDEISVSTTTTESSTETTSAETVSAETVSESTTLLSTDEEEFLNLINEARVKNGLSELLIDDEVENIARLKAQDLVDNDYFSHTSPTYGTPFEMLSTAGVNYKTASENIAGNSTISGAVTSWLNSESHKNNILSNDFNYTGVAIVNSNTYGKILVQIFIGR